MRIQEIRITSGLMLFEMGEMIDELQMKREA